MQTFGFGTTVFFIFLFAFIMAFIRGRIRDKCLKDFNGSQIVLELQNKNSIRGKVRIEISGMEIVYDCNLTDKDVQSKHSYLLFKSEYANIQALVRFHDELDDKAKIQREKELNKTYHPNFLQRLKRKIVNIFKTVRDSVMDLLNLLLAQAKKTPYIGTVLQSQDAYVSKVNKEIAGFVGSSYDPLLERHIGHLVVFEMLKQDKLVEYTGVLKEYTDEFIEFMDVKYCINEDNEPRIADIVVPRKVAVVRYSAE